MATSVNDEFEKSNLAFELQRNVLNVVCTGEKEFTIVSSVTPVPLSPSGGGKVVPAGPIPSNETVTPSNETVVPPSGDEIVPSNETVVP